MVAIGAQVQGLAHAMRERAAVGLAHLREGTADAAQGGRDAQAASLAVTVARRIGQLGPSGGRDDVAHGVRRALPADLVRRLARSRRQAGLMGLVGGLAAGQLRRRRGSWRQRLFSPRHSVPALIPWQPIGLLALGLGLGYVVGGWLARCWLAGCAPGRAPAGHGAAAHVGGEQRAGDWDALREEQPEIPPPSAGRVHDDVKLDVIGMHSFPASDPPPVPGSSAREA